jgi:hypothetical protein
MALTYNQGMVERSEQPRREVGITLIEVALEESMQGEVGRVTLTTTRRREDNVSECGDLW